MDTEYISESVEEALAKAHAVLYQMSRNLLETVEKYLDDYSTKDIMNCPKYFGSQFILASFLLQQIGELKYSRLTPTTTTISDQEVNESGKQEETG